ncbi:MAG: nucleoside phosphorylase [Candidatus Izemoplasmataceae bacterium]
MKKDIVPILEFDEDLEAFIEPSLVLRKYKPLPEKLIITFFHEAVDNLLKKDEITLYQTIKGENHHDMYLFKNHDVAIVKGSIGSAACAGFYEEYIALGAKEIIFCGGAGALDASLNVGALMIVEGAIRDEGLSYHYLKPSRTVEANPEIVNKIERFLKDKEIPFIKGIVWTTDAFYRETRSKIKARANEGALMVDMEQAGLLAVSKFRGVSYGAILYAGDDLSQEIWDGRLWHQKKDLRENLITLCLNYLIQDDH